MSGILEVKNLTVEFATPKGSFRAVNDISFSLEEGETLGIVGESGCGKSVTSLSIMGLLPKRIARIQSGEISYRDTDLLQLPEAKRRLLRGKEMSMIFQDPLSSLDPLFTVQKQMAEGLKLHLNLKKDEIRARCEQILKDVGIHDPQRVLKSYPHQLSGGMIQRVMIAMGLSLNPQVLIADEPTTALDVTVQAQVLALMDQLKERYQTSIILITHNMGVVSQMCDRVLVMYCGEIVEAAPVAKLFANPRHPYTRGLLQCIPTLGEMPERIPSIPGMVPALTELQQGCLFAPRCPEKRARCEAERPATVPAGPEHFVKCPYWEEAGE